MMTKRNSNNSVPKRRPKPVKKRDANRYPKGWDRERVQRVLNHYENQSDEGATAEDEAAYHSRSVTMMAVPVELVPAVQKLISKRAG